MIHFGDHDSMDLALIDELPVCKAKEKKRKSQTRSILPWFRRRGKAPAGIPPPVGKEELEEELIAPDQVAPDPLQVPQPPRKSSMRDAKNRRKPKSVGLRGPSGEKTGRSRVHPPPEKPPPPVPSNSTARVPRGMEVRLSHRTIITRGPCDTAHVQPISSKSKSPSHVRNRHTPFMQSVARKRLSTKLEEAAEILAEDSNPGQGVDEVPLRDIVNVGKPQQDKPQVGEPRLEKPPVDRPQLATEHSFSPTPPAMVGRSGRSTPRLPITWQYAVGTPSSFEMALDDVVRKLDEMEAKPGIGELAITLFPKPQEKEHLREKTNHSKVTPSQPVAGSSKEQKQPTDSPSQKPMPKPSDTSSSSFLDHKLQRAVAMRRQRMAAEDEAKNSKPAEDAAPPTPPDVQSPQGPPSEAPHPDISPPDVPTPDVPPRPKRKATEPAKRKISEPAKSLSAEDITVDHYDRDISDRDVLKGLKLAVSAACDENLDAWIRGKTGLRLRRFLADLKTFENLGVEEEEKKSRLGKAQAEHRAEGKKAESTVEGKKAITKVDDKETGDMVNLKAIKNRILETVEGKTPEGNPDDMRTSAGVRRPGPEDVEAEEPENKRTSVGARKPQPEASDQKARKRRAEKRKAQAEKELVKNRRKHILQAET